MQHTPDLGRADFLAEMRRLLTVLDQAHASVQATAAGYRGTLRISLPNGIVPRRLAAQCREEEPEICIRARPGTQLILVECHDIVDTRLLNVTNNRIPRTGFCWRTASVSDL